MDPAVGKQGRDESAIAVVILIGGVPADIFHDIGGRSGHAHF